MPTHNGNPVFRQASGAGAGRGDNAHVEKHGEEGMTRTQPHPLQGRGTVDTVGRFLGSTGGDGQPRSYFFSAESTEGGESDSHMINDTEDFKAGLMNVGDRYAFSRELGHSGTISEYDPKVHYGIPGAPMDDTPAKYHDRNYQ